LVARDLLPGGRVVWWNAGTLRLVRMLVPPPGLVQSRANIPMGLLGRSSTDGRLSVISGRNAGGTKRVWWHTGMVPIRLLRSSPNSEPKVSKIRSVFSLRTVEGMNIKIVRM
jgi:hypothetical protein